MSKHIISCCKLACKQLIICLDTYGERRDNEQRSSELQQGERYGERRDNEQRSSELQQGERVK